MIIPLTTANSFASVAGNAVEDITIAGSSVSCNGALQGQIIFRNLSQEQEYIHSAEIFTKDIVLNRGMGDNTLSYSAMPVPAGQSVNLPFTITQEGGTTEKDPEMAQVTAYIHYDSESSTISGVISATQSYFITGCPLHQQDTSSSSSDSGSSSIIPSRCLIATAAFGSDLAPQVQFLRVFRDQNILSTAAGSSFMNVFNTWYYSFSPSVANYERGQPWMQEVVRTSIYPLLGMLTLSQHAYSVLPGEYGAISAGLIASSLIGAVYFVPFGLAIKPVRQHRLNPKIAIAIISASVFAVVISVLAGNGIASMVSTSLLVLTTLSISAMYSANMIAKVVNKFRNRT